MLRQKFKQTGTDAVNRDITLKLAETISVKDFGAVGDDDADDTFAIQAAINSFGAASSAAQGVVYFPPGKYKISAALVLPFEVSLVGVGRGSKIRQETAGADIITWSATAPSFSRIVSITDLWLMGPGVSSGGTPSAININHPWGIDQLTLKRLWIEEFNGYGIRTNQPTSGVTANCFQFSDWDSIYIRNCGIGCSLGYGFTGESTISALNIQFCTTSCLDFTINAALTGPQGLNFVGLNVGWSPYGVRMLAGTAGNIKFDMLHIERCTTAGLYLNSSSINKVILDTPWFVKCPDAILGAAGGQIDIYSPQFRNNGSATDTFLKLTAASNFVVSIAGSPLVVSSGVASTDHIVVPDMSSVLGAVQRKSSTTGTLSQYFDKHHWQQSRGIMSETATVAPNNLAGWQAIAGGASSVTITFARAETDAAYRIVESVDIGSGTITAWIPKRLVGNKTTTGFTVYFDTAAPSGGYSINWVLVR